MLGGSYSCRFSMFHHEVRYTQLRNVSITVVTFTVSVNLQPISCRWVQWSCFWDSTIWWAQKHPTSQYWRLDFFWLYEFWVMVLCEQMPPMHLTQYCIVCSNMSFYMSMSPQCQSEETKHPAKKYNFRNIFENQQNATVLDITVYMQILLNKHEKIMINNNQNILRHVWHLVFLFNEFNTIKLLYS